MSTIVGMIRDLVRHELQSSVRFAEPGVVEAVYPHAADDDSDNYGCDVRLKNSQLLLKRVPIATGHIGTVAIPNVGDLVILQYWYGDVNQPIVIGRLYTDDDRPPLNKPNEVIFRLPLHAADDDAIRAAIRNIADNDPPREILVEMSPKIAVQITDDKVRATAGKTEMTLDQPGSSGGVVTVVAGRTKLTMNQDGDVKVESVGAMEIQAGRDLKIGAQSITIDAQASLTLQAAGSAKLKANGQVTVQAAGAATVQAATVQIKGVTSFSP
jgi:phage baseplate assembly protein gpV